MSFEVQNHISWSAGLRRELYSQGRAGAEGAGAVEWVVQSGDTWAKKQNCGLLQGEEFPSVFSWKTWSPITVSSRVPCAGRQVGSEDGVVHGVDVGGDRMPAFAVHPSLQQRRPPLCSAYERFIELVRAKLSRV